MPCFEWYGNETTGRLEAKINLPGADGRNWKEQRGTGSDDWIVPRDSSMQFQYAVHVYRKELHCI